MIRRCFYNLKHEGIEDAILYKENSKGELIEDSLADLSEEEGREEESGEIEIDEESHDSAKKLMFKKVK